MNMRTVGALFTSALFVTAFQAAAQEAPALPKVLRIFREEIKQGKAVAHEKSEAAFMKFAAKYKYPAYVIGCDVLAGPTESWFFEGHESFKSIENNLGVIEKNTAMKTEMAILDGADGELRSNGSSMIAVLRDDLSYRAGQFAQDLPKTRYFTLSVVRIRPYTDLRFAELGKQVIAANEKANNEVPVATYQVVSGGPSGMYMLFSPMKSLDTMDEAAGRTRAMMAAMGSQAAALYKSAGEVLTSSTSLLLAINPKMSFVAKDFAAQDPGFWTPKPAAAAKPAVPKAAEKPGAGQ